MRSPIDANNTRNDPYTTILASLVIDAIKIQTIIEIDIKFL